jgi:hypothetical protein
LRERCALIHSRPGPTDTKPLRNVPARTSTSPARSRDIVLHQFALSHCKHSRDLLQGEATTMRPSPGTSHIGRYIFSGLATNVLKHRRISLISALLIRLQQAVDILIIFIVDDIVAYFDAFIADEGRRRARDQRADLMLRLAAEGARKRFLRFSVVQLVG